MPNAGVELFEKWGNFYVIVGSSAAALTGLMFVAVSLMPTARGRVPGIEMGILAFNSPTVVHLCSVFLIAAVLSMPWGGFVSAGWAMGVMGVGGVAYGLIVVRRMFRMGAETPYRPMFEDWLWHNIIPNAAYAILAVAGLMLPMWPVESLYAVAAASLILLLASIHNAWDIVTYIAVSGFATDGGDKPVEHVEPRPRFGSDSWTPPSGEPPR
jgi:hypothetical protein